MSVSSVFLITVAVIFGTVIGSFLNVVAYRVPAGISLMRESRCPGCGSPVQWYHNIPVFSWFNLLGRCAACDARISFRYPVVEAATGLLFGLVAWFVPLAMPLPGFAGFAVLLAFWWFAAITVVLVLIDLDTKRLPDVIVLPSYAVGGVLLLLACLFGADWGALLRAGIGLGALYGFYALLRLVRPGGMGGGDVKLAGVAGMYLGWLGWGPLMVGGFAAFLLGGVFGIALLASGRAQRRTAIPFGPWLLAGAWVGVLAGVRLGAWYGGLYGLY